MEAGLLSRTGLVETLVASTLRLVTLETEPEGRSVDGFRLRGNRAGLDGRLPAFGRPRVSAEMRQRLDGVRVMEPRIEMIARLLAALDHVVEFLSSGEPVRVVGFRLRSLDDWLVNDARSPAELLNCLLWQCGLACRFCYERGKPPGWPRRRAPSTSREVETRFGRFDVRAGSKLFEEGIESGEVLTRPGVLAYLKRIRALDPDAVLPITTAGVPLNETLVAGLARLKPILLSVSLNSANPDLRRRVMGDRHPEVAIGSLPLLRRYGIPYAVTIVAAGQFPMSDIERTIRYADVHEPLYIKVLLPSYTRFHPRRFVSATQADWDEIVCVFGLWSRRTECPPGSRSSNSSDPGNG
jgi:hypothetical protein